MSELLHHDENAVDPDGPNGIDVSRAGVKMMMSRSGVPRQYNYAFVTYSTNSVIFSATTSKAKLWKCPNDLYSR